MSSFFFRSLRAERSGGGRLEGGGLALKRTRDTRFRMREASSCDKLDKDLSTEDINIETGMRVGDGAKFRPFLRISSSGSRTEILDRLITHCWSVFPCANLPETSLLNLAFCRSLHLIVSAGHFCLKLSPEHVDFLAYDIYIVLHHAFV